MITTINEFRKFLEYSQAQGEPVADYNDAELRAYYDKLIENGSEEQDALLNTSNWFRVSMDYVHQSLKRNSLAVNTTIY